MSETSTLARPAPALPPLPAAPARATAADYVTLLKPRIMLLILITTVGTMALAADGLPRLEVLAATVAGMALVSGGSSALNHWYDRDIDARMTRTATRPVASGRVAPAEALAIGVSLGAVGLALLALGVNWLAACWAAAGFACYVGLYTMWLKRSTAQNIVWGGAAGAVPPLVGWAAVTGDVTLAAFSLFLIIFLWTPPHFWALAILLEDDYRRAGVPMLPTVAGARAAARQIAAYTAALLAASLLPLETGDLGWVYGGVAALLGARFAWLALRLVLDPSRAAARRTFLFSLTYLAALFAAMALDRSIR